MTFTKAVVVIIVSGFIASPALAQTGRTRRTVAPRATSTRVIVHEMSGTPIPGVHVTVLGGGGEQATTDAGGVATVKLGRTASRIRVARQGVLRMGDHAFPLEPGSVSVIPRGVTRGIERRGRTPLVMLSTTAGVPCPDGAGAPPRGR